MEIKRLFDIPYYQLEKYPQKVAIGGKHQGRISTYSTQELLDLVNQVSLGLLQIGLKPGDKVALISYNNRPEWNIMDLGMLQIGVINVPVYPTISPDDYVYIFNDSEVKYCFVGDGDLLDKVRTAQKEVPSLREVFTFDEVEEAPHWMSIFAKGDYSPVEEIKKGIKAEDLATIIYTSGTTGRPKGVMLSHDNIASNVRDVMPMVPVNRGESAVSFLPLCHIFERTVTYTYMALGIQINYAESIETLADDLQTFKPHFFTTVPRLLEKVYEKIYLKTQAAGGIKFKLFKWALSLTEDYDYDQKAGGLKGAKLFLADKLIFSKIRARLGGNLKGVLSGAAACPVKMIRFFSAIGIPVREGYGLTETSPAIAIGRYEKEKAMLGTVGPLLPSVKVRLDDPEGLYQPGEGEILVKGPNIMLGYYNKPEKTAEVFTEDGWFRTGDIGQLLKNKHGVEFLQITDRKKELLKTSGGKYVAPTPIENKLKEDFLIEQVMVVGEGRKFVSAILVPAMDNLKEWASQSGINTSDVKALLEHPKVMGKYESVINKYNRGFSKVEQIKEFRLVPEQWDVSTGELTPTMKLKRRVILSNYDQLITDIYERTAVIK